MAPLAGAASEAEAKTYKQMFQQRQIFHNQWDRSVVDPQWEFLELAKKVGVLEKVPPKEKHSLVLQ